MTFLISRQRALFFFLFLLLPSACFPGKKTAVVAVAPLLEEVAKSSSRQTDLKIIREGMPAYLMLMDGMIEAWPDNERLLMGAAQGYSSFASLFIVDQDQEYAKRLYGKAKDYALRALERKGVKAPLLKPLDDFEEDLKGFSKKEASTLFWVAACWGNWISLNLDSMEALADLPKVERMMKRVLDLDEGVYYGGPHLFLGIWFSSRPRIAGGDLKKAQDHFLKAIDLGQGKFLMAYVYYAEYYARKALDRNLFISTLQKVLESPVDIAPELNLVNTAAKRKAKESLSRVEEYFE